MATKKYVSLDKLTKYDALIKAKIAADDAAVLAAAKKHAEDLGVNYDAAGAAATVQGKLDTEIARAKGEEARIEGLVSTAQGEIDALELVVADKADKTAVDTLAGKVGTVPEGSTVMDIINGIQESAYDDTQLRADMATELAKKADKTQVATDIAEAVAAEKERAEGIEGGLETRLAAVEEDYLKAADKTELEGKINAKADKTALDEVSAVANAAVKQADYDVKVAALEAEDARIVGLVEAEAERAAGVEEDFESRIAAMETFWDATEDSDGIVNKLKEIQDYIAGDETGAAEMAGNIQANTQAIADHIATDHDFAGADAALKAELEDKINAKADASVVTELSGKVTTAEGKITTLEGEMDTVEGKVATLEGQMTTVQGAVAAKVEQSVYDAKIAELEGADADIIERIDAVESLMGDGEGSVADQIADVKSELQGELATAIADAKTDASNKDAVVLAEAQKGITAAQTAIDTHTANADIHVTTTDKAKWNAALQASDIVEGTANGTISVKGNDVAVKGLGSAAYKAETAFDASGSAAQALVDAKAHTDSVFAQFVEVSEEEINALFA